MPVIFLEQEVKNEANFAESITRLNPEKSLFLGGRTRILVERKVEMNGR
jgi:hypothetical protein